MISDINWMTGVKQQCVEREEKKAAIAAERKAREEKRKAEAEERELLRQ